MAASNAATISPFRAVAAAAADLLETIAAHRDAPVARMTPKPDDIAFLERELQRRRYDSGQTIISTGDTADEMFVVLSGTVEVQIHTEDKSRKRVDVLTSGMTVGEMAFLDGSPRSADVVAMEPVECLVLPKLWFDSLNERRPTLKITLLQEMTLEISSRLRQANVAISAFHRF